MGGPLSRSFRDGCLGRPVPPKQSSSVRPRGKALGTFGLSLLLLAGCKTAEITEYQVPATILRAFRKDHPQAQAPRYSLQMRDGFRVYQVEFLEGDTESDLYYDVQGRIFVSKADRRRAEQEREAREEEARQGQAEVRDNAAGETVSNSSSSGAASRSP